LCGTVNEQHRFLEHQVKQTDPQLKLRLPPELMEQIRRAAEAGRRTMSAEIIRRLEITFSQSSSFATPTISEIVNNDLAARVAAIEFQLEQQIPVEAVLTEVAQLESRFTAIEKIVRKQ
jgi:predicted component of type VI protein secretion system